MRLEPPSADEERGVADEEVAAVDGVDAVVLVHELDEVLLGEGAHNTHVRQPEAEGGGERSGNGVLEDILMGSLEPGHDSVGGEQRRLRLHLRRGRDHYEVFLRPVGRVHFTL